MKKSAFIIIALVLAAVVAVAGCVTTPSVEAESPVGDWIAEGERILILSPDGVAIAIAGNVYKGTWEAQDGAISIKVDPITKMVVTQENATFIGKVNSATGYSFKNSDLVLTDGETEGYFLAFKRNVAGTWVNDEGITLRFDRDGTVSATAGVNIIFGTYQFTETGGFAISMPESGSTLALGSDEEMEKEQALIITLGATRNCFIKNGNLILVDADGKELLILEAVPFEIWSNGDVEITLKEDGTATIVADNTYQAEYKLSEKTIALENIMQLTNMIQTDEEKAFFEILASAGNTFERGQFMTAHSLISADEPGKVVLVFMRL